MIFQEMYIAGGVSTILQEMYKNDISGDVYRRWCEYNIAGGVKVQHCRKCIICNVAGAV